MLHILLHKFIFFYIQIFVIVKTNFSVDALCRALISAAALKSSHCSPSGTDI